MDEKPALRQYFYRGKGDVRLLEVVEDTRSHMTCRVTFSAPHHYQPDEYKGKLEDLSRRMKASHPNITVQAFMAVCRHRTEPDAYMAQRQQQQRRGAVASAASESEEKTYMVNFINSKENANVEEVMQALGTSREDWLFLPARACPSPRGGRGR